MNVTKSVACPAAYRCLAATICLAASAILLLSALLIYYQTGDRYQSGYATEFGPQSLEITAGEGRLTDQGLAIIRLAARGVAALRGPDTVLSADDFNGLHWDIDNTNMQLRIDLVWTTDATPQQMKSVRLSGSRQDNRLDLREVADWRGRISGLGLLIRGRLMSPVVIRSLRFEPVAPSTGQLLTRLWQDWTAFEGWGGYSINFIVGGVRKTLISPVLAGGVWVSLSVVLYLLWSRWRDRQIVAWPVLAMFLLVWLLVDSRWQWDLWRQLTDTRQQFAGKTEFEKRRADVDGPLFEFIQTVRSKLPDESFRLFIVSADPVNRGETEYLRLRSHYHLLPYNVYSALDRPPTTNQADSGDYVLVFSPISGLQFDSRRRQLQWRGQQLSAELIYNDPNGALFRVL